MSFQLAFAGICYLEIFKDCFLDRWPTDHVDLWLPSILLYLSMIIIECCLCCCLYCCILVSCQEGNDKLDGVDIEEVCADRPADEYFRLDTEGDCREVYR